MGNRTDRDSAAAANDPGPRGLLPVLSSRQIFAIAPFGIRRALRRGDVIFSHGELNAPFIVLLSGAVELFELSPEGERVVGSISTRTFIGDVSIFSGARTVLGCRVVEPADVVELTHAGLVDLCGEHHDLADLVLATFISRRSWLQGRGFGQAQIYGTRTSPACHAVRELIARNQVPHQWIDVEHTEEPAALLQVAGVSMADLPVVVDGETVLRRATVEDVATHFQLRVEFPAKPADVLIVGAGPAGLAAAVYAASEGLATVCVDAFAPGGQAGTSSRIENYLGFPNGVSGEELATRAALQARRLGVTLSSCHEVVSIDPATAGYRARLSDGQTISARSLILATGARYRTLDAPGLTELTGAGVYASVGNASTLDLAGQQLAIVGAGNSAGQAALDVARTAQRVHLLVRGARLEASMSAYLVERIQRNSRIKVHRRTEVSAVLGDRTSGVTRVVVRTTGITDQPSRTLSAKALFVMIGSEANSAVFRHLVACDARGFVLTGADLPETAGVAVLLGTSAPGVFAIGDIRSGSVKRVATAVGDGALVIRVAHDYLESLGPRRAESDHT